MNSKYFNITVKPDMTGQNAVTAFANEDLMFDWTSFLVPKGGARLIAVTALVRGVNITRQAHAMDLYFAKATSAGNAPTTLGTVNGTAAGVGYFNELLGCCKIVADDYRDGLDNMSVSHTNVVATGAGIVMDDVTPSNGYNTYYLGVIALGAFDFGTGVLSAGGQTAGDSGMNVDGNAAAKAFAVGDVLVDNGNAAIGTIKSLTNTVITLESGCEEAVADNDEIVTKNPITFILHFER
tara:strand:- start:5 stop:718 length:714 start_codon:yes stop_codon:yes gene_type:complete